MATLQSHLIITNEHQWHEMRRKVFMTTGGEGCVIAEIPANEDERHKPYIYNLHVEEKHRRKGLATALLTAAEDWLRSQGCKIAALGWDKREAKYWTLDWYVRRGYEEKAFGDYSSYLEKEL